MANLKADLAIFNALRSRLADEFGLAEDDEAIVGTAAGELPLPEVIAQIIREARLAEAMASGIGDLVKEMQDRRSRLAARSDKLRGLALWACQEAGLKRIDAPDFTASLRAGRQAVVTTRQPDAGDDPAVVNTTIAWDKAAIRDALDAGKSLDFAFLSNPEPVLSVRGK